MRRTKVSGRDRLAEAFKQTAGEQLQHALGKTAIIQMRVSVSDKAGMTSTAGGLGLTLTDYLTRLHYFAADLLKGK